MRIDEIPFAVGAGVITATIVGGFGSYVVKPIFESMSPAGVALTCGITVVVAIQVLISNLDIQWKFIGFMSAYPFGLMLPNLMGSRVHFLHPLLGVCVGGALLTPMVLTALFFATISN